MAGSKRQLSDTEQEDAKRAKASSPEAEPVLAEEPVAPTLSQEPELNANADANANVSADASSKTDSLTEEVKPVDSNIPTSQLTEADVSTSTGPANEEGSTEKDESSQENQKQAEETDKSAAESAKKTQDLQETVSTSKSADGFGNSTLSTTTADAPEAATEAEKKPVADEKPATDEKPKMTVFGNFGSKFSFGSMNTQRNSLMSAGSSNPWAEPSKLATSETKESEASESSEDKKESESSASASTSAAPVAGAETGPDRFAKVKLQLQSVETGEENEEELFSSRAALYALNLQKTSEGWKNRGTGTLHLNRIPNTDKVRVVMRADGLLRVILNVPILLQTEVSQGFQSSSASEKFVRFHGVEDSFPHQYAVRMQSKEQADAFYNSLTQVVDSIV